MSGGPPRWKDPVARTIRSISAAILSPDGHEPTRRPPQSNSPLRSGAQDEVSEEYPSRHAGCGKVSPDRKLQALRLGTLTAAHGSGTNAFLYMDCASVNERDMKGALGGEPGKITNTNRKQTSSMIDGAEWAPGEDRYPQAD